MVAVILGLVPRTQGAADFGAAGLVMLLHRVLRLQFGYGRGLGPRDRPEDDSWEVGWPKTVI